MPLDALIVPLATASAHHITDRIIGIVFIALGAFTFMFRRALVARNPDYLSPSRVRLGQVASVAFVVVGLILIAVS